MNFYLLEHIRYYKDNNFSDQKIIGIYSSKNLAEDKILIYRHKEGFSRHKEGFSIQKFELKTDKIKKKNFVWILEIVEPYPDEYHDFIKIIGLFLTKKKAEEIKKSLSKRESKGKKIYI